MKLNELGTSNPTASMRFRWPWRPYQARLLGSLDVKLADRRLHVVAAPGSGKTCLGLEVFRRLGRPTVVLSPTRTIRDQWLSRLEDFLEPGTPVPPPWCSRDIGNLAYLTSLTYQGLHARYRDATSETEDHDREDAEAAGVPDKHVLLELVTRFRASGVGTIILDEAHHLRREWWEALIGLVRPLDGVIVVSLTATPPYDAVGREWQRYEALCGPIDEQISVPELVRAGTICPHQDYVWAVEATPADCAALRAFDAAAEQFVENAPNDSTLLAAVEGHPFMGNEPDPEAALENPELLSAMLALLAACGRTPPEAPLSLLGCRAEEIPPFDRRRCAILFQEYLHGSAWPASEAIDVHRRALMARLRGSGLLWRHELRLDDSPTLRGRLRMTNAKVHACVGIYRLEREVRGESLRQLILTDFIAEGEPDRLGASPIFETLRGAVGAAESETMALLTGRVAVVHQDLAEEFAGALAAGSASHRVEPLEPGSSFRRFVPNGDSAALVKIIGDLFARGRIQVLVSTRALLGEGWDAPAVNSVVLASFVGSFVLSNQMRGRALRTDPADRMKTSSIWHIIALDVDTPSGFWDYDEMERRFKTFVGLAAGGLEIEAGLRRLELPTLRDRSWFAAVNRLSTERLQRSADLAERWSHAIDAKGDGRVIPCVTAPKAPPVRRILFGDTLKHSLYAAAGAGAIAAGRFAEEALRGASPRDWPQAVTFLGIIGLLTAAPGLARALTLWARCLPADGSIRQIGRAVLEALVEAGEIRPDGKAPDLVTRETSPGVWSIGLPGGDYHASCVFASALQDVLGPIENPRYLVSRRGFWRSSRRLAYHPVPRLLGEDKEKASTFHRCWQRRLGPAELIYTRSAEGRTTLLRARARSFATASLPRTERLERWQ